MLFTHDLFGKPLRTFPDHALVRGLRHCSLAIGDRMAVNKITWDRVGRVTEPGRYMYTFGWLTITAGDLRIWEQYPRAAFTLLACAPTTNDAGEEFHLGAFDV